MSECPVCRTQYVKGRLDRCHVCGWQLDASGFSMIGPVKIEHRVSDVTLTKIQAWAHHMWTTLQQQKNRILELQGELRQAQNQPAPPAALPDVPTGSIGQITSAPSASVVSAPIQDPTESSSPAQVWRWVLTRLEQAEAERDELRSAIAQLQVQQTPPQDPPHILDAEQLTPQVGELHTELIKFREESQNRQYRQSEQWQEILDGFRGNIQQSLAQQERNLQTSLTEAYRHEIAALNAQVQTQQQVMSQLELRLQTLQDAPHHVVQGAIAPLTAQIEVLKTVQDNVAAQLDQKLAGLRQSQATWKEQQEERLAIAIASVAPARQLLTIGSTLEQHKHELAHLQQSHQRQFQALQDNQTQANQVQKQFVTTQLEMLQQSQDQLAQQLEQQIQTLQAAQADSAIEQKHQLHEAIATLTTQIEALQQSHTANHQNVEQQLQVIQPERQDLVAAAIAPLHQQIETLQAAQHELGQRLEQQVEALEHAQNYAIAQAIAPLATRESLHTVAEGLQALIQEHQHTAAQLEHYIREFERTQHHRLVQSELCEPQPHEILEAEHQLVKWQEQGQEIVAKMAQFDTFCEQFQSLEATVLQIQQSLQNLTPSQPLTSRRSNTVYTRYQ